MLHGRKVLFIVIASLIVLSCTTYKGSDKNTTENVTANTVPVTFVYPVEDPLLMTSVQLFVGSIYDKRVLASLAVGNSVVVPVVKDEIIPIFACYSIQQGNRLKQYIYPDWDNEDHKNDQRFFLSTKSEGKGFEFVVPPLGEVAELSWGRKSDFAGTIKVVNKSGKLLEIYGKKYGETSESQIDKIAVNSSIGYIVPRGESVDWVMNAGEYSLYSVVAMKNAIESQLERVVVRPGQLYNWIINDVTSNKENFEDVKARLEKTVQNWKIRSNVPGASIDLSVDSNDIEVKSKTISLGITNSDGEFLVDHVSGDLLDGIILKNSEKILLSVTVSKDGYLSRIQTVNAYALLVLGGDFMLEKFTLDQQGIGNELIINGIR